MFDGQKWVQGGDGSEGTCVASSTVTSRAMVDPLYALELTGGPDGQEDDPEAFKRAWWPNSTGCTPKATAARSGPAWAPRGRSGSPTPPSAAPPVTTTSARTWTAPTTAGGPDRSREGGGAEGKPVPVDVKSDDGAHAMTIIGQEGDMLQIYNPWGTTTWVSEDDFINGHMGKASNSELNDAYSVYVPN